MFGSWYKLGMDATMLAFESQQVIGMRLIKIAAGGAVGQAEAQRMVTEKVAAAGEAALMVASGASTAKVIAGYRRKVRANARRLSKG
jgi:urease beta subunit